MRLFNELALTLENPRWASDTEFALLDSILSIPPEIYKRQESSKVNGNSAPLCFSLCSLDVNATVKYKLWDKSCTTDD